METLKITPNDIEPENAKVQKDEGAKTVLDIKSVLEDYSLTELKFKACQNGLLGNFDKNKEYHILDILYPELVAIYKTLQERTPLYYRATAKVEQINLNFVVKTIQTEDKKLSATLFLEEKLVVAKAMESVISTPLKTIVGEDNAEFAQRIRKEFHIFSKDEMDQMSLFENYVSPPIEVVTEIIRKADMLEILGQNREKLETEYVNNVLSALKPTDVGAEIVKNFLILVKQNELHEVKDNRTQNFKELLDFLIDEQIEKKALGNDLLSKIAEERNAFLEQSKKEAYIFLQEQKKGIKGFIGSKKNLDQELLSPKPAKTAQSKASAPSAPKPSFAPRPSGAPSPKGSSAPSQAKPAGAKIEFVFFAPKSTTKMTNGNTQAQPRAKQGAQNSTAQPSKRAGAHPLSKSIFSRAQNVAPKQTAPSGPNSAQQINPDAMYMNAIKTSIKYNFGVNTPIIVSFEATQTNIELTME